MSADDSLDTVVMISFIGFNYTQPKMCIKTNNKPLESHLFKLKEYAESHELTFADLKHVSVSQAVPVSSNA